MNKKTRAAIAASKGRTVYYLNKEESAVVDRMRADKRYMASWCKFRPGSANFDCRAKAERDGYCLNHWKTLERMREDGPPE